jgi:hypothetical protein
MAGLVPAIHVLLEDDRSRKKDVDARHKAGHDDSRLTRTRQLQPLLLNRTAVRLVPAMTAWPGHDGVARLRRRGGAAQVGDGNSLGGYGNSLEDSARVAHWPVAAPTDP